MRYIAAVRIGRLIEQLVRDDITQQTHIHTSRPGKWGSGTGRMPTLETYRGNSGIGAIWRWSKIRQFPILFRYQAYARSKVSHRSKQGYRRGYLTSVQRVLTSLFCEQRPGVPCTFSRGSPGMAVRGTVAIAITVIAVPAWSARRIGLDSRIDYRERLGYCCIIGSFETQAHQFQETGIDDGALIKGRSAVTDVVANCCIRVASLGESNKVGVRGQRTSSGNGPSFNGTLPVVGLTEPDMCTLHIAVHIRDIGCCYQASDFSRDSGWRVATLLFPALRPK